MSSTTKTKSNTQKLPKQEAAQTKQIANEARQRKTTVKKQKSNINEKAATLNSDLASTASGYQSQINNMVPLEQAQQPVAQSRPIVPNSAQIHSQKIADIEKGMEEIQRQKSSNEHFQMTKIDIGAGLCMNPNKEVARASVPQEKKIKAKVNTGLSRSKSYMSKKSSSYKESSPKYRQDASPKERLETDLQFIKKQMTEQQKEGIKHHINSKYAELESLLVNNVPGWESPQMKKTQSDASDYFERATNQDTVKLGQSQNLQGRLDEIVEMIKEKQAKEEQLPVKQVEKIPSEQNSQREKTIIEVKKLTQTEIPGEILYQSEQKPAQVKKVEKKTQSKSPIPSKNLNKDLDNLQKKPTVQVQKPKNSQRNVPSHKIEVKQQPVKKTQQEQPVKKTNQEQQSKQPKTPVKKAQPQPKTQPKSIGKQESTKFSQTMTSPFMPKLQNQNQSKTPKALTKAQTLSRPKSIGKIQTYEQKSTFFQQKPKTAIRKSMSNTQKIEIMSAKMGSPKASIIDLSPKKLAYPQKLEKQGHGCKSQASFKKHKKMKLEMTATDALSKLAMSKIREPDSPTILNQSENKLNQSCFSQTYNLTTKEDYLNFDIEHVWKEMEELGKYKKEKDQVFTDFQDKFYDRKAAKFNDTAETSPTKRLVQLKNATFKHHAISYQKGIKDDSYQLQYTTGPGKSIVVKPQDGEINYGKYSQNQTQKLVNRILQGEVEEIKLIEKCKSPAKREQISSPVKILAQHVTRLELGQKYPLTRLKQESVSSPKMFGGSIESDSKGDHEAMSMDGNINIRLDTEDLPHNLDIEYKTVDNSQHDMRESLLVEARK